MYMWHQSSSSSLSPISSIDYAKWDILDSRRYSNVAPLLASDRFQSLPGASHAWCLQIKNKGRNSLYQRNLLRLV
ncbi:hypothetical protein K1719_038895 [Acacia pycnantha]|nr:hypothetical protein K1719_038895 [Acacia pycnantha]